MIDLAYIKAGTVEGDTISRQAAVEVLHFWEKNYIWDEDCLNEDAKDIVVSPSKMIEKLPSAQLDLQPTCNQLATDCISRQAAILQLSHNRCGNDENDIAVEHDIETIRKLSPVQPDRSLWFRIGEILVDESKGHISSEIAIEKIRKLMRDNEDGQRR